MIRFALSFALLPLAALAQSGNGNLPLPPNPKAGECYARVYLPAQFTTETVTLDKTPASERIELIPAQYEWVQEPVLVKPEEERIVEVSPAEYRWVEEQVLVKPASETLREVPATYKTEETRELVRPAVTEWKPGRGLIEKVDNLTGEVMCLIETPAEYRTVQKRVLVTPARVEKAALPAEYATVRRQELVKPAEARKQTIPAQYKNVAVKKLVKPAEERRVAVPATTQTVERKVLAAESRLEWRPVLCETNATPELGRRLQLALQKAGYNPGAIDGTWGRNTLAAVANYQKANGMASGGGVTLETLAKLGVQR